MTNPHLELSRYNELEHVLTNVDDVTGVSHAEDYVPPHKSAGFTPYDAVVALDEEHWGAGDVEEFLADHDLTFDRVTGVGRNDSQHPGDALAFVSLVHFES